MVTSAEVAQRLFEAGFRVHFVHHDRWQKKDIIRLSEGGRTISHGFLTGMEWHFRHNLGKHNVPEDVDYEEVGIVLRRLTTQAAES